MGVNGWLIWLFIIIHLFTILISITVDRISDMSVLSSLITALWRTLSTLTKLDLW